ALPISRTADAVAGVFVPAVIGIAVVAGGIWWAVSGDFSFALKIFTSILVIACPCAMGLATPTAIIVGTGLGANQGILIRNGEALEITHSVSTVIFDKTGTITAGEPAVTDIVLVAQDGAMPEGERTDDTAPALAQSAEDELLRVAFALEQMSEHPLSKAICGAAQARDIVAPPATDFENMTGHGLRGKNAAQQEIIIGNAQCMQACGIETAAHHQTVATRKAEGKTVVFVAKAGQLLGFIAMADTLKPEAKGAIAQLHGMGIQTVLLTGDNAAAAHFIAAQVGIDEVVAEVLPTGKSAVVQQYQAKGQSVMMVGDGINDAPALTQADIGCAIGNGSDIAIDCAEVVLMKSDIRDVPKSIALSKATIRNIKQNLFWAFIYNTLGIPVAAGVLYPAFGLLLSPMVGGLAMSLSSLFVVSNALRLKGTKL
ncbi:MAG: heavy metal translocating P-type ATPase, partial [Faecalibacterium sp.]